MLDGPWQLTEAEQREIQRLREELGTGFCQRCDYCQPCAEEIPISTVISSGSLARGMPLEHLFSGEIAEAIEKAFHCNECGECEDRCPFHLPIREMLAEQVEWYQKEKRRYQEQTISR